MPDRSPPYDALRIVELRRADPGPGLPAAISAALEGLAAGGVLEVVVPFEPSALVAALGARGCPAVTERRGSRWLVRTGASPPPPVEELTELPAPEPMERVLTAVAALPPGGVYLAALPHRPVPLLPHLAARGLTFASVERPDGTALLWVRR